jgi:hypothetical protein
MSPAFVAGTAESLPNAQITFDKFHVVKLINEAVDEVRRAEQKSRGELKKSRSLWLKNPRNLSQRQRTQLDGLSAANLKTGRAYRIRLAFQERYLRPPKMPRHSSRNGTGGPPTAACRRSSKRHAWSTATGTASSAGSTPRSPTASWKPSTASSKPPKPRPGD